MTLLLRGTDGIVFSDGSLQSGAAATPHCGRLEWVSQTQLSFKPYRGNKIQIDGRIYDIPPAGIAGLNITGGVFRNSVAGQVLTEGSYYVYAFDNAGMLTADFCDIGFTGNHVTSTQRGNVGVETRIGDDTRTLLGMIYVNAGPVVQYASNVKMLISWFNRRNISINGGYTSTVGLSGAYADVSQGFRPYFVNWGDEAIVVGFAGIIRNEYDGSTNGIYLSLDGTANIALATIVVDSPHASYWHQVGGQAAFPSYEGMHYACAVAYASPGAGYVGSNVSVTVRG